MVPPRPFFSCSHQQLSPEISFSSDTFQKKYSFCLMEWRKEKRAFLYGLWILSDPSPSNEPRMSSLVRSDKNDVLIFYLLTYIVSTGSIRSRADFPRDRPPTRRGSPI